MDPDDRRRYFIVGSVILEIVTPVFRQRLEKDYKSKGLGCLQDFINSKPVIHLLFHLSHKNIQCCKDTTNCKIRGTLPLNYIQWDLLYTENPGPANQPRHQCYCLYTTKNVKLDDLDITLASLILLNCCNLTPIEETFIKELRKFKNTYLSHNTKGAITENEFQTLWKDLKTTVLQLDPSKEDDFERIQNRPLDESLCNKYFVCLLDIHKQLEEISDKLESSTAEILTAMNITNGQSSVELLTKLEKILEYVRRQSSSEKTDRQGNRQKDQNNIGQSIFELHHQINLSSIKNDAMTPFYTNLFQNIMTFVTVGSRGEVSDIVMMDDGRLVMCFPIQNRLLICDINGSHVDSIPVQGKPWYVTMVTAVNNSTIAIIVGLSDYIEMYDINNKLIHTRIPVPGMRWGSGITTLHNKLVVCADFLLRNTLLIIDPQTGKMVQTKKTECDPGKLQSSGDRIFYCDSSAFDNNNVYLYSYSDDSNHTLTLQSPPRSLTSLQDGSLYVVCDDGSLQHVSADNKASTPVNLLQSTPLLGGIHYNRTQRKLVIIQNQYVKIFHEK